MTYAVEILRSAQRQLAKIDRQDLFASYLPFVHSPTIRVLTAARNCQDALRGGFAWVHIASSTKSTTTGCSFSWWPSVIGRMSTDSASYFPSGGIGGSPSEIFLVA